MEGIVILMVCDDENNCMHSADLPQNVRSSFWKISADEDFLESSFSVDEYLSTNILKRIFFPDFRFSCTKT